MCAAMTKQDLQVFVDCIVSAHTDYKIVDDPVTLEQLFLAVQDAYMAMVDADKEQRL